MIHVEVVNWSVMCAKYSLDELLQCGTMLNNVGNGYCGWMRGSYTLMITDITHISAFLSVRWQETLLIKHSVDLHPFLICQLIDYDFFLKRWQDRLIYNILLHKHVNSNLIFWRKITNLTMNIVVRVFIIFVITCISLI